MVTRHVLTVLIGVAAVAAAYQLAPADAGKGLPTRFEPAHSQHECKPLDSVVVHQDRPSLVCSGPPGRLTVSDSQVGSFFLLPVDGQGPGVLLPLNELAKTGVSVEADRVYFAGIVARSPDTVLPSLELTLDGN